MYTKINKEDLFIQKAISIKLKKFIPNIIDLKLSVFSTTTSKTHVTMKININNINYYISLNISHLSFFNDNNSLDIQTTNPFQIQYTKILSLMSNINNKIDIYNLENTHTMKLFIKSKMHFENNTFLFYSSIPINIFYNSLISKYTTYFSFINYINNNQISPLYELSRNNNKNKEVKC